jgi:PAS domain S-box-containing protein
LKSIGNITENTFEIEEIQKIPLKEYRTALDRALTNLIRKGMPYNMIFRIRRPSDGVLRDIHSIAHFSRENNRVFGVIHDITDTLQRERALQESEKRFRRVIEENPLPMVLTDKNQDIISFNKKFTDFYGYTTDDIKTAEQWWTSVYPDEEYREKVRMMWDPAAESAMESKSEIDKQTRIITCKDGEVKTVEFRFVSLGDINVISVVDLTELKNFEKELIENKNKITSQYEELAALNEELQSNLEESSRINRKLEKAKQGLSDSHQRATRLLDQTRKRNTEISMLLAGAREVLESDDFESTARKLYRYIQKITRSHDGFISMRNQESGNQEVILLFQHNRFRKVSHQFTVSTGRIFDTADKPTDAVIYNEVKDQHFMSGLPDSHPKIQRAIFVPLILENSLKGTFCLANKKGEYTREEKKIVSAFGELAAIALRNSFNLEELRNQKEKAEESDRLKSAFLSNMSHEIRTPMNSIVGFSEFLSRDRISDEKRKKFSRLIAGSSEQLMSRIKDVIDISKI